MTRRDPNGAVYAKVRRILHADWDPIFGGTGEACPEDEYDTYAGRAYSMLVNGSDAPSIAAYLDEACETQIGMRAPTERSRQVATKIIALKEQLV